MKRKYFCFAMRFLLISALYAVPVNAQDSDISLSEILPAVQKNVDLQKERMVNILSREDITIEEFNDKEELSKMGEIISNYRVFPATTNAISECNVLFSEILEAAQFPGIPREEREMLSIEKNDLTEQHPNDVFWAKGNIYADLFSVFDKQNERCFDYRLIGAEKTVMTSIGKIKERDVYAIEIKQKGTNVGQANNMSWIIKNEGVALVDAGTMEIVQLNRSVNYTRTYKNSSKDWAGRVIELEDIIERYVYDTQYEYDRVRIENQFLTLPTAKIVELFRENGQLSVKYTYRYSDHKMFTVGTKIMFDAME